MAINPVMIFVVGVTTIHIVTYYAAGAMAVLALETWTGLSFTACAAL